jgi:hypothetical protein
MFDLSLRKGTAMLTYYHVWWYDRRGDPWLVKVSTSLAECVRYVNTHPGMPLEIESHRQ